MEEINPKDKEWFSQIKEPVVLKSMSSVNGMKKLILQL